MSGTIQQVMYEPGVRRVKSYACHPESQGTLGSIHQTLTRIIRINCFETENDWIEECLLVGSQESQGFSPLGLELVFGHRVTYRQGLHNQSHLNL